jgi:hypothetical protein
MAEDGGGAPREGERAASSDGLSAGGRWAPAAGLAADGAEKREAPAGAREPAWEVGSCMCWSCPGKAGAGGWPGRGGSTTEKARVGAPRGPGAAGEPEKEGGLAWKVLASGADETAWERDGETAMAWETSTAA